MKVYLVGGAVRDKLLGRAVTDNDFVVVGSTAEQMIAAGFEQVGADFPVFLHPTSKQEYALARTERKSGQGYKGFTVYASPNITLQEDLLRRDLTINAMAVQVTGLNDATPLSGEVIDPYNGQADLANKQLRHVSAAFSEDPLRVLRVARFYSRFAHLGFNIANETLELMQQIASSGELNQLTQERIWQESSRATLQNSPQLYWQTLHQVKALKSLVPMLDVAWQNVDTKRTISQALLNSAKLQLTMPQRWAVLMSSFQCHDDSNTTHATIHASNQPWLTEIDEVHKLLKVPKAEQKMAKMYAQLAGGLTCVDSLSANQLIDLVQNSGAHKTPMNLEALIQIATVFGVNVNRQKINQAIDSFKAVSIKDIDTSLQGKAIGHALTQARVNKLQGVLAQYA